MAKNTDKKIVSKEVESKSTTTTKVEKDPLREQILALRAKGFDNNRIASLLAIHKQTVDKY